MEIRLKNLVESINEKGESWIQFKGEKPTINERKVDYFAPSGKHQFIVAYEGTIDEVKVPANVLTEEEMASLEKCVAIALS